MPDDITRNASITPSALPQGTRLGEFELRQVLGVGGFGIVYLAFDHALEREVAVKEYMPASLVGRTETMHVTLRSHGDAETFAVGLRSFVNEARLLARFDHPSLLKVHRFWEANGTAYMAMPVLLGKTLKELRLHGGLQPDEAWLRRLLEPLLGAIERLHNEGVYHRDIAPDNIQIEPDGHPVLMDFGAARRVIADKSQHLTAILKPAYAPIEQYAEIPSVKQGPWTDLYALGATVHYMLLGKPPTPSTARAVHDDTTPLAHQAVAGCSVAFLRCIDWMLAPRPNDRPQNVAQLREALAGRLTPPHQPAPQAVSVDEWQTTVVATGAYAAAAPLDLVLDDDLLHAPAAAAAAAAAAGSARTPAERGSSPRVERPQAPHAPAQQRAFVAPAAAPRSKLLPLIGGLAVVAAVAIGAAAALWPQRQAPMTDAAVATPTAALPVAVPPAASATVALPVPVPLAAAPDAAVAAPAIAAPASGAVSVPAPTPAATAVAVSPSPVNRPQPPATIAPRAIPQQRDAANTPSASRSPESARPAVEPYRPPPPAATPPAASPAVTQTPPGTATPEPDKSVATGPEAVCGARNPVMYFVCMERECLRSRWSGHADCLKWRASRPQN